MKTENMIKKFNIKMKDYDKKIGNENSNKKFKDFKEFKKEIFDSKNFRDFILKGKINLNEKEKQGDKSTKTWNAWTKYIKDYNDIKNKTKKPLNNPSHSPKSKSKEEQVVEDDNKRKKKLKTEESIEME